MQVNFVTSENMQSEVQISFIQMVIKINSLMVHVFFIFTVIISIKLSKFKNIIF